MEARDRAQAAAGREPPGFAVGSDPPPLITSRAMAPAVRVGSAHGAILRKRLALGPVVLRTLAGYQGFTLRAFR